MHQAVIAVLLIANVAFSGAVFLKKPSTATFAVFNQLQDVENSDFGKKILDTIALQLKNKSPLQDVAKLLAEIRQDLSAQQLTSDQLHQQQEAECTEEVAEFERRISVAEGIRVQAEGEIATLQQEISALQGEIRNKQSQLDILNQREVELRESRARDADDFVRRQAQSVEVIGALDVIIQKFSTIQGSENAQVALADLAKLGTTNPIMALVEVASTFSQDSLDKVKVKLEELRANLQQSVEDDKANEEAALGEFQALTQELEEVRTAVSQALQEAQTKLKQQQAALELQEKILADAVAELKAAQDGKAVKLQQCEDWRNKYAADTQSRTAEIGVVKQVEEIIATKLETMKDYLKERAGLNE